MGVPVGTLSSAESLLPGLELSELVPQKQSQDQASRCLLLYKLLALYNYSDVHTGPTALVGLVPKEGGSLVSVLDEAGGSVQEQIKTEGSGQSLMVSHLPCPLGLVGTLLICHSLL